MGKNAYTDRFLDIVFSIIKPISKKDFADGIGLNKHKFRNIEIGANGVPIEALCNFLEAYPQINANYILTGRGSMFISENGLPVQDESKELADKIEELQGQLKEAYEEIGRLNMEIRSLKEKKARTN